MAKKILVVDDEPDILFMMSLRLQTAGYDVLKTASGEQTLDVIKKTTPDLILLDLLLPKI